MPHGGKGCAAGAPPAAASDASAAAGAASVVVRCPAAPVTRTAAIGAGVTGSSGLAGIRTCPPGDVASSPSLQTPNVPLMRLYAGLVKTWPLLYSFQMSQQPC